MHALITERHGCLASYGKHWVVVTFGGMRTPSILGICSPVPIFLFDHPLCSLYRNCSCLGCILCAMHDNRVIERWPEWGHGLLSNCLERQGCRIYTAGSPWERCMVCCSGPWSSLFGKLSYRCFNNVATLTQFRLSNCGAEDS